jgi:hypothetical protein
MSQTQPASTPGVEDKPATDDDKLVENINEDPEDMHVPKGETHEEGVDNIDDDKDALREDLKGDSLGGTAQVGESPSRQRGGG